MIRLDDDLLRDLGLAALPAEEKPAFLKYVYDTLETRVGMAMARQLSDDQLDEFEVFIDTEDEAGALRFLEASVPTYKQMVQEHFALLKQEIKEHAEEILAASSD